MRALSHLFFKVTLSSMIVSAPAMTTGSNTDANYGATGEKEASFSYNSSAVIKRFVNYSSLVFTPVYSGHEEFVNAEKAAVAEKFTVTAKTEKTSIAEKTVEKTAEKLAKTSKTPAMIAADKAPIAEKANNTENLATANTATGRRAELNMVISQAVLLYDHMNLQRSGLDEKAFEYAWRGYHNLLKKGLIRKKNVLSICDFSQSSRNKRMYVIDIRHQKLLYRTYVAHGQNSGAEFADSFSNQPDSYKSSLGFYVTSRTYYGRNGLSLKIEGLDSGYNDLAGKRNIVLHGCSYAGAKYLQHYGSLGTSLGCPAIPSSMSPRIIRVVKNGSVLFIYHPTQEYLDGSSVINSDI
jgi:hypothetical protein